MLGENRRLPHTFAYAGPPTPEEVTNELVDWFNAVDATYRADLRELNELNFARFDAKLEQRLAELSASLRIEITQVKSDLVKWMFVFWAPTALGVVSLLLRR
jgi:hypothetical protein